MNIFEQYGIKEVADCTLYAIELDKYDDEVYVPILYFDTLKVSTLEQSAEQTSARGGLGNPELITWDFGKEITLTLEDALYSPASQSLMWGGKFGVKHSKIQGLWNPYIYPKDRFGRTLYLKKTVISEEDYKKSEDKEGWIKFICPCDNEIKYMKYEQNDDGYKYSEPESSAFNCPKGYPTAETQDGETATLVKTYYWNIGKNSIRNQIKDFKDRPERAEIIIDNYGEFNYDTYTTTVQKGLSSEDGIINLNTEDSTTDYCIYKSVSQCNKILGSKADDCGENINAYGYNWRKSDIKMVSLEGNQDIYYAENTSIRYRVPKDSTHKEIMIARQGLYQTKYENDEWVKDGEKEVTNFMNLTRQNDSGTSYGWFENPYDSKIDFYINISWTIPSTGVETEQISKYSSRVLVGTFYIVQDWNTGYETQYDLINPIESGMENVSVLERMEKCKATQTFCLDTDRNLKMANYRYMPEYSSTELTIFIDPKTMKPYEANTDNFVRKNGQIIEGNLRVIKQHDIYYKWTRSVAPDYTTLGHQIIVDATHFPGTYRLIGETCARSRIDGKDQRYQFEIPLCKMSSDTNLTLEAAGDPTTFNMTLKALRREDGVMVKLTQYNVDRNNYDGYLSGSTKIIPIDGDIEPDSYDTYVSEETKYSMKITNPEDGTTYLINKDNQTQEIKPEVSLITEKCVTTEKFNTETLEVIDSRTTDWTITDKEILGKDDYVINISHEQEANS